MNCRYDGPERPRLVRGEHLAEGCECPGCLPCAHDHCRICGIAHAAGTCPECMAEVRANLREIGRLCDSLPEEVETRGVEGEAMMLLGPAADPEARGHLKASVMVGRVPEDYLDEADSELHPLFVLGTWDMLVRDVLEHDEPAERLTVAVAITYLDKQLTYLGGFEDLPFDDMARDLRACVGHMERVLHDGEQIETGAPCLTCKRPLLHIYERAPLPWEYRDGSSPLATEDCWACNRCKVWRGESAYRLNVAEMHRQEAEWLTTPDMIERTGVSRGSLTGWASTGKVRKRTQGGRVVYRVTDVLRCQGIADDDGAA